VALLFSAPSARARWIFFSFSFASFCRGRGNYPGKISLDAKASRVRLFFLMVTLDVVRKKVRELSTSPRLSAKLRGRPGNRRQTDLVVGGPRARHPPTGATSGSPPLGARAPGGGRAGLYTRSASGPGSQSRAFSCSRCRRLDGASFSRGPRAESSVLASLLHVAGESAAQPAS
jgi:hypothetical protein